jgi:hypothetical protein
MSLLYKGKYYKRFESVIKQISGRTVTEICFGDIVIAGYCKKNSIQWVGVDINEAFVKNALKKGFKAEQKDVQQLKQFPKAETCIICGSLYHFHEDPEALFIKMLACAPRIIISEPVINLSNDNGIIGKLAKASATVNGKKQTFRYTKKTLIQLLDVLSKKLQFEYSVTEQFDKDLIIVIKNE